MKHKQIKKTKQTNTQYVYTISTRVHNTMGTKKVYNFIQKRCSEKLSLGIMQSPWKHVCYSNVTEKDAGAQCDQ